MTVIAFKDGLLAADTATWSEDLIVTHSPKIHQTETITRKTILWAASGNCSDIEIFRDWVEADFDRTQRPDRIPEGSFAALIFKVGYHKLFRCHHDFRIYSVDYEDAHVEGSHCAYLLGALHAGKSATEAVWQAIVRGMYAGGEIHYVNVNDFTTGGLAEIKGPIRYD
jgi:hypothetical protein